MPEEVTMPSVADEPLHSFMLRSGQWYACAHPERPSDKGTCYDWRCWPCVLAAQGQLINAGGKTQLIRSDRTGRFRGQFTLESLVKRALTWHAARGRTVISSP